MKLSFLKFETCLEKKGLHNDTLIRFNEKLKQTQHSKNFQ